uniref:DPY30 domain-containing protein 2 n=1 Tax=Timema poppense TaxID=170557 RepID=A0A7R9DR33_TIMPO|nr:unnamed protein product [Timema poppensis]
MKLTSEMSDGEENIVDSDSSTESSASYLVENSKSNIISSNKVVDLERLNLGEPENSNKSLDSEYLKKNLGVPLSLALAEVAMKCPTDPIHYLAHWLFKWRWNQEHKQDQEDRVKELTAERTKLENQLKQAKEREDAQLAATSAIETATQEAEKILNKNDQEDITEPEGEEEDLQDEARDAFDNYDGKED